MFYMYKKWQVNTIKRKKRIFSEKARKNTNIFLEKEKTKGKKMLEKDNKVFLEEGIQCLCHCNKNLSEEIKQGIVEYGRNY